MNLYITEEDNYNLDDFIHFGYFPKGKLQNDMKDYMKKISEKDVKKLTYEEKRLLDSYTLNGSIKKAFVGDTFKELNYNWFLNLHQKMKIGIHYISLIKQWLLVQTLTQLIY